jgi:integrase
MMSQSNSQQRLLIQRTPIDLAQYDRTPALSDEERVQIDAWVRDHIPIDSHYTQTLTDEERVQIDAWVRDHIPIDSHYTQTLTNVPAEWATACQQWYDLSDLPKPTRDGYYIWLLRIGRWLECTYPNVTSPAEWTPDVAYTFVQAVTQNMIPRSLLLSDVKEIDEVEKQFKPSSIDRYLAISRTFFTDCREKRLFSIQIVPERDLQTPKHIRRQIEPNPRAIVSDVWKALLCAGIELSQADLDAQRSENIGCYPLEMVRALAMIWLFGGLRPGQIRLLEVDCIEWQLNGVPLRICDEAPPLDATCYIKVPPHKGMGSFSKDVSPYIGLAIQAWEHVRSETSPLDNKGTNTPQKLLFVHNMHLISETYLNKVLIPLLCRKAGVDIYDTKGKITAHRARSNALTELAYNRERPRTLDDLRRWAGHGSIPPLMSYIELRKPEQQPTYNGTGRLSADMLNAAARQKETPLSPVQIIALQKCVRCPLFQLKHSGRSLVLMTRAKLLEVRACALLNAGDLTTLSTVIAALDSVSARFTQERTGDSDG